MAKADDIAKIIEQERGLVFPRFDEAAAFALGSAIFHRGLEGRLPMVVDIRLWDRPLFFAALPGATRDNAEWVRRKSNTVRQFHKSTYRVVLERAFEERVFPVHRALPVEDFAIAGGGFPISIAGVGVIGSVTISGLPERDDHGFAVAAVAGFLGHDPAAWALGPEAQG
jgi:uncharacterized protein (UPF0303 family)